MVLLIRVSVAVVVSLLMGMMGGLHAKDENAVANVEPKHEYKKLPKRERPTWRFEFANDVFFDSDNQFTNGTSSDSVPSSRHHGLGVYRLFELVLTGGEPCVKR